MSTLAVQLLDVLPRPGLIIDNRKPFTVRAERDDLVFHKLQEANVIDHAFLNRRQNSSCLNRALESMFFAAAKDEVRAKLTKAASENDDDDGEGGYLEFVDEVKKKVDWAQKLTSSVFLDFFTAVLRARVAWNDKPRYPAGNKPKDSSASAKAAQALLDIEPGL
ncbi:hypothetical protein PG985_002271 [Apiospora marii]|uniref:Uncharacterized protein n=1 Tax=Apiospora marii TaxID=335849 RepID=A0ABR1RZ32_9PEZI